MPASSSARSPEDERRAAASTSPCVGVCVIDAGTQLCWGCQRSREEIRDWVALGDEGRRAVLARLATREGR